MSNLEKPFLFVITSWMFGKGKTCRFNPLLSVQKSVSHLTLPSFFGWMKVGEAHGVAPIGRNTPILTK